MSLTPKEIPFRPDPNSTANEMRFRMRDPKDFDKDSFKRWKEWAGIAPVEGIGFVVGEIEGEKILQAIRFDKSKISEQEAADYWASVKDKPGFEKHWIWERKSTYVGTVGFNNRKWDGPFYPAYIKENERLKYYSTHLSAVEINATMHTMPRRDVFERWASQTHSDFVFAFRVVYGKRLAETMQVLFRRAQDTIGDKRFGPVCIVIPNGTPYNHGQAQKLFSSIPHHKYALDIKSEEWFNTEVTTVLAEHNGTLVRDHLLGGHIDSDWEYLRLPISSALKFAGFSTDLRVLASVLTPLPEEKSETFIFTKDEINDELDPVVAPGKAKRVMQVIRSKEPPRVIDLAKSLGPGGLTSWEGKGNSVQPATAIDDMDGPLFEVKKDKMIKEVPDRQKRLTEPTSWVDCLDDNNGLSEPAPKVDPGN